jgi:hypothetical protein
LFEIVKVRECGVLEIPHGIFGDVPQGKSALAAVDENLDLREG